MQEKIAEKERQIAYCENETKKQSVAIGILTASNSFRCHKLNQLDEDIRRFNVNKVQSLIDLIAGPYLAKKMFQMQVTALNSRCEDMENKLDAGNLPLSVVISFFNRCTAKLFPDISKVRKLSYSWKEICYLSKLSLQIR